MEFVINYSMPNNVEDYVHRIGRTGRAGKKGVAHSFFVPEIDGGRAKDLIKVLEKANQPVPPELRNPSAGRFGSFGRAPPNRYGYGSADYEPPELPSAFGVTQTAVPGSRSYEGGSSSSSSSYSAHSSAPAAAAARGRSPSPARGAYASGGYARGRSPSPRGAYGAARSPPRGGGGYGGARSPPRDRERDRHY